MKRCRYFQRHPLRWRLLKKVDLIDWGFVGFAKANKKVEAWSNGQTFKL